MHKFLKINISTKIEKSNCTVDQWGYSPHGGNKCNGFDAGELPPIEESACVWREQLHNLHLPSPAVSPVHNVLEPVHTYALRVRQATQG